MLEDPASASSPASSDGAEDCASRLRVLAEGTRLEVLRRLREGPQHPGALQQELAIPQNLLSHHLRVLREAGLVAATRQGRRMLYSLSETVRASEQGGELNLGCCTLSFDD